MVNFQQIKYSNINSRQKEIYNFQKVSGVLADYGFATYRLTDDWNGADFLAVHFNGEDFLRVQLKGRLTFEKKYMGKDLWVCFLHKDIVYLYPHDELLSEVLKVTNIGETGSWKKDGGYSFPSLPKSLDSRFRGNDEFRYMVRA